MKILVTGATGLVGSYTLYSLLQAGHEVCGLRRTSSSLEWTQKVFDQRNSQSGEHHSFDEITWLEADITDVLGLMEATNGIDAVIHAAALVSFDPAMRDEMERVNELGTKHVVDVCIANKVQKLVHISSIAALPLSDSNTVDERFSNTFYNSFKSPYGKSKYRAEMQVWRGLGEGLDVTVLNPSVIIGAWKFSGSSVEMFKLVANGFKYYPAGSGGFVDVRDVAQLATKAVQGDSLKGERFIINQANLSYQRLLTLIAKGVGVKPPTSRLSPLVASWVGRLAGIWAAITGSKPFITLDMARSVSHSIRYSNQKVVEATGHGFVPIEETIQWVSDFYNRVREEQV